MALEEQLFLYVQTSRTLLLSSFTGIVTIVSFRDITQIKDAQKKIRSKWKVDDDSINLLLEHLIPRTGPCSLFHNDAIRHPDVEVRDNAMVFSSSGRMYAEVTPLDVSDGPDSQHGSTVTWHSERAWHDELVKTTRLRDYDAGKDWNIFGHGPIKIEHAPGEVRDSYFEPDHSDWAYLRQQERDKTLTLSTSNTGERLSASLIQDLDKINLVEEEMT